MEQLELERDVTVEGSVARIIFQNQSNGYTVLVLVTDDGSETLVGCMPSVSQGLTIRARGEYVDHPTYGIQIRVDQYEIVIPKGSAPEAELSEEDAKLHSALMYLQDLGIGSKLGLKVYRQYGEDTYDIVRDDPYRLACDIDGIGFVTADRVAARMGLSQDSDPRIRGGIVYTLQAAVHEGDVYLPLAELVARTQKIIHVDPDNIVGQLRNLAMNGQVVMRGIGDEARVYAPSCYYYELACARKLLDLSERLETATGRDRVAIAEIASIAGYELDELQKQAVIACVENGLLVISGGPGTGKTTTINTLIRFFEARGAQILLAAPTGRAAKRMTQATGHDARTIHRLLEVCGNPGSGPTVFNRNENRPLEADLVIIDEMSMVDVYLMNSLLKAISCGTRLVLVGDVDQLPSVGPGQILRDIIDSHVIPVIMLEKIFRQAADSDIVVNAHKINRGEHPALDNSGRDFFFRGATDTASAYETVCELASGRMPGYAEVDTTDIQVLTPMRKGPLGSVQLCRVLQARLNPAAPGRREHRFGDRIFREGDKVMQIKNDYELEWEVRGTGGVVIDRGTGVFNGDIGTVTVVNDFLSEMEVEFDEGRVVTYPYVDIEELDLAYAVTIHKSQGSEYSAVVMVLLTGPAVLMTRNLLYTGVTRAKSCAVIVGSRDTVMRMVDNTNVTRRRTGLRERLMEMRNEA